MKLVSFPPGEIGCFIFFKLAYNFKAVDRDLIESSSSLSSSWCSILVRTGLGRVEKHVTLLLQGFVRGPKVNSDDMSEKLELEFELQVNITESHSGRMDDLLTGLELMIPFSIRFSTSERGRT